MLKGKLILKDGQSTKEGPSFPLLAMKKSTGDVWLFGTTTTGTPVVANITHSGLNLIGEFYFDTSVDNEVAINALPNCRPYCLGDITDSSIWEILPIGTKVELIVT